MMRLGSVALAALVLFGGAAWAATGDPLVVTGDGVNVRTDPSTASQVMMQVYRDQQVIELERQGPWVRVEIADTDGVQGWIHGSLLAPLEDEALGAVPEPAAGPAAGDLGGLAQFRESVDYLNQRAQDLAGVDLFSGVEPAGEGVVQVVAAEGWSTVTPAGQQSFLNTLLARWTAARGGAGPASVQIVDPSGRVVMEKSGP